VKVAAMVAIALLAAAPSAQAQDDAGSTFVTRALHWSPTLQLNDFGYDSNVFSTPKTPLWDLTATLVPAMNAAADLTHIQLTGTAKANLAYYERYRQQRSVGGSGSLRAEFPMQRFVPSLTGSYGNVRDVQSFEIVTPQRHQDTSVGAGLGLYIGTRLLASLAARSDTTTYARDAVAQDVDLARVLDRNTRGATASLRFALTPLTSLVGDAAYAKDRYLSDPSKDQRTLRADIGLDFEPDAVVRGHLAFGYHSLNVVDPTALPYKGYTSDVDLSYLLLSVTRFTGRFSHDTATSIQAPYYVQTSYGLDVEQQFVGPFSLLVRYNRQLADYQAIPARHVDGRTDTINTYGTGVSIRFSVSTRMTINYELAQHRSLLPDTSYDRERVTTSVTMGF
jgi:hypothetical protein